MLSADCVDHEHAAVQSGGGVPRRPAVWQRGGAAPVPENLLDHRQDEGRRAALQAARRQTAPAAGGLSHTYLSVT